MQYEQTQKELLDHFNDVSFEMKRLSDNVSYSMLESMQTVLDFIEEMFEKVMLPPSLGNLESNSLSGSMT